MLVVCALSFAQEPSAKNVKNEKNEKKSALDKPTMEAYLRHQFLISSTMQVLIEEPKPSSVPGMMDLKVIVTDGKNPQEVSFLVTKDGQKVIQGKVFDIAQNPFRSDLDLLKTEFQPSIGTPGAPVVLVLFSDFQCSFCGAEAKMLRQNLLQNYPSKVRLYHKDFPLEQIHPWSKAAAIAGRCIFRQNPAAFWEYHDWIFDQQSQVISPEGLKLKLLEWAPTKNLDVLQLNRCLDTRDTEKEVDQNLAEGRALQLSSTPTLFVNGRRMVGQIAWQQLRGVIDAEIEYQKTAKNAGEDCGCEIKPSVPLIAK
jgi:protein-disulfide isomerase